MISHTRWIFQGRQIPAIYDLHGVHAMLQRAGYELDDVNDLARNNSTLRSVLHRLRTTYHNSISFEVWDVYDLYDLGRDLSDVRNGRRSVKRGLKPVHFTNHP